MKDPREVAPPLEIDASRPQAAALLARLEDECRKLRVLRKNAPPRSLSAGPLDQEEQSRLEALGYGGEAKSAVVGGDHLCIEGCIWRP